MTANAARVGEIDRRIRRHVRSPDTSGRRFDLAIRLSPPTRERVPQPSTAAEKVDVLPPAGDLQRPAAEARGADEPGRLAAQSVDLPRLRGCPPDLRRVSLHNGRGHPLRAVP